MRTLDKLQPGESGMVVALHGEGAVQQRLLEMGIIEGTELKMVRRAPMGDPIELVVQGYHLSIRKAEAKLVELQ